MKLEPKEIGGELPRDQELDGVPTDPPIDDRPWADSSFDLARGLDVAEVPVGLVPLADVTTTVPGAWQPLSEDEQAAWALGRAARNAGAPPDASPFEPGTALDLCWMDGYRVGP